MNLQDRTEFDDRSYEVTWQSAGELPARGKITQVSAICYSPDDQIVMISGDGSHWGIPGGHPGGDEPLEVALRREIREEACCEITGMCLLGWQHVLDVCEGSVHYQLKYCCRVHVRAFRPEHEILYRKLVPPSEFLDKLECGTSAIAREVFTLAQKAIAGMKDDRR